MKTFRCTCGNMLYFENTQCVQCGRMLGFLPDELVLSAFEPDGDHANGSWLALAPEARGHHYRKCRNYSDQDACNWMVPADDVNPFCIACRLNEVIPNLDKPGNRERWLRVEKRKRRLIHDLRRHRLPLVGRDLEPQTGLAFAFMEDDPGDDLEFHDHHEGTQIMTGHANGLITINIAEADDVERERMRVAMNEAQRTLLGHFRHESGHYYWDRLVRNGPLLGRVRELFGDEREDYQAALGRYYNEGAQAGWQDHYVSAYASSHPWEDWAECWAHLLQIVDTLETAAAIGMAPARAVSDDMDERIEHWVKLAVNINLLNRSLDQPDPYPFVLTPTVIDKLKLVNTVIESSGFSK